MAANGVKSEEYSDDDTPLSRRKDAQSDSEDEKPLSKRKRKSVVPKEEPQSEEESEAEAESESEGEESSDDDVPLNKRKNGSAPKRKSAKSNGNAYSEDSDNSEDDKPLSSRQKKPKKEESDYSEEEEKPKKKVVKKENKPTPKKPAVKVKKEDTKDTKDPPKKRVKKEPEPEIPVWKWWLEEKLPEGIKWKTLTHNGPCFPDAYEPLPKNVHFKYDGDKMKLSEQAEECATFYAKMLDHEYTTREVFRKNFFSDWREEMTQDERDTIKKLELCDFSNIHTHFLEESAARKNRTKEEKEALKLKNKKLADYYGVCTIDSHLQKVGNFRIEPPGLFRGRGDHPKQGRLKRRVNSKNILINIGKGETVPDAPDGGKWKKVQHDNKVTWLACWKENVLGGFKYVMLNPTSKLKGEKDYAKYETARKLKKNVEKIREKYREEFNSKEMFTRQRAVALYFIDKLALRAGNEKDEDEADTVGCCSLRVEHIKLHEKWEDKEFVVEFDFLGKDSIRYQNWVAVNKRVFKNLKIFIKDKEGSNDLFDRLNTSKMNEYLQTLMPGLTAKVFRTFNASVTLQEQLIEQTDPKSDMPNLVLGYNRANRAVAILCNHQRAIPKGFDKQMENLVNQKNEKVEKVEVQKAEYKKAKHHYRDRRNDPAAKKNYELQKRKLERMNDALLKLKVKETDKEENKTIALGTSKLNYLDPRISVAWCKKHSVPLEKVYNKTQREKFQWAVEMATEDFEF